MSYACSARMLGDIVCLHGVRDSYSFLTEKVVGALRWALHHLDAQYVLKLDEDTWADMVAITTWISQHQPARLFYGGQLSSRAPKVKRSGLMIELPSVCTRWWVFDVSESIPGNWPAA